MKITLPRIIFALFFLFVSTSSVLAFGSSSASYNLEGEFGIFGGAKSSASYNLTDTGGGFAVGFGSSANYGTGSGFQYVLAEVREIIFTMSSNSVNLGSLSTGSVTTGSHTITVTTNGAQGYQVTVVDNGNICRIAQPCDAANDIADVGDGEVTVAAEEYGLATSKAGQDILQDAVCGSAPFLASGITGTAQSVASSALPIDEDGTTICYAASISGTTAAGDYTHVLTYIATGTF